MVSGIANMSVPRPCGQLRKGGGREPRTLPLPISSAVMEPDLPSLAPPTHRANSILGAGACSSSSSCFLPG